MQEFIVTDWMRSLGYQEAKNEIGEIVGAEKKVGGFSFLIMETYNPDPEKRAYFFYAYYSYEGAFKDKLISFNGDDEYGEGISIETGMENYFKNPEDVQLREIKAKEVLLRNLKEIMDKIVADCQ